MAYPWVKLWTEIVHDPKIGRLSEHLQLVFVKLLCVTGEHDSGRRGSLPPVDEMAWTLRLSDDDLLADLEALERTGIVACEDGVWRVTNFATRQGPMTATGRVQAFRERQHKATYYGTELEPERNDDETNRCTDVDVDVDKTRSDVDVDVDGEAREATPVTTTTTTTTADPLTAQFFTGLQRMGVLLASQMQAEAYQDVVASIRGHPQPEAFIAQLFDEAAKTTSGRITPRWFEAVTERCLREGRLPGARAPGIQGSRSRDAPARNAPAVDWDAVQREAEEREARRRQAEARDG